MNANVEPKTEPARQPAFARIRSAWRGNSSLAWAFWSFHFGGGILLFVVASFGVLFLIPFTYSDSGGVLSSPVFQTYLFAVVLIYLAYAVASAVMVWRCAFNTGWVGWAYAARGITILWVVRLMFFVRALLLGTS